MSLRDWVAGFFDAAWLFFWPSILVALVYQFVVSGWIYWRRKKMWPLKDSVVTRVHEIKLAVKPSLVELEVSLEIRNVSPVDHNISSLCATVELAEVTGLLFPRIPLPLFRQRLSLMRSAPAGAWGYVGFSHSLSTDEVVGRQIADAVRGATERALQIPLLLYIELFEGAGAVSPVANFKTPPVLARIHDTTPGKDSP